jgi:hypothetical protein
MSTPNDRTYVIDANLVIIENDTKTASGFAGGAAPGYPSVVDLGGNQGTSPVQQSRIGAVAVCDVTALDITSGNETYKLMVLGSNDPGLATGNVCLGEITLGKGASIDGVNMADSVTGRYEIMFCNVVAGAYFQYVGLYVIVGGTTPSISYTAFVAPRGCP